MGRVGAENHGMSCKRQEHICGPKPVHANWFTSNAYYIDTNHLLNIQHGPVIYSMMCIYYCATIYVNLSFITEFGDTY